MNEATILVLGVFLPCFITNLVRDWYNWREDEHDDWKGSAIFSIIQACAGVIGMWAAIKLFG